MLKKENLIISNEFDLCPILHVSDKLYIDNGLHELSKEGSSDSGVSTPDPSLKPKKIIHEVIVWSA